MAQSKRITEADFREMFCLLGECREVGDDTVVWQTHLAAGLGKFIDADVVMVGEINGCLRGPLSMPGGTAWGFESGFNIAGYQTLGEWLATDPTKSHVYTKLRARLRSAKSHSVTVPRQEFFTDDEWYRLPDYQVVLRTMGTDAVVHSQCPIDEARDSFSGLVCCRAAGKSAFSEREVTLIGLANEQVARLIGGPLTQWSEPRPSQLPPRERQVLRCLLEGDCDKQIASRLNLSPYTVNQYTKDIFRHFGVHSRTTLLARWVRRGWGKDADWDAAQFASKLVVHR